MTQDRWHPAECGIMFRPQPDFRRLKGLFACDQPEGHGGPHGRDHSEYGPLREDTGIRTEREGWPLTAAQKVCVAALALIPACWALAGLLFADGRTGNGASFLVVSLAIPLAASLVFDQGTLDQVRKQHAAGNHRGCSPRRCPYA